MNPGNEVEVSRSTASDQWPLVFGTFLFQEVVGYPLLLLQVCRQFSCYCGATATVFVLLQYLFFHLFNFLRHFFLRVLFRLKALLQLVERGLDVRRCLVRDFLPDSRQIIHVVIRSSIVRANVAASIVKICRRRWRRRLWTCSSACFHRGVHEINSSAFREYLRWEVRLSKYCTISLETGGASQGTSAPCAAQWAPVDYSTVVYDIWYSIMYSTVEYKYSLVVYSIVSL